MRVTIRVSGDQAGDIDVSAEEYEYRMIDLPKNRINTLLTEAVRKVRLAYEIEDAK